MRYSMDRLRARAAAMGMVTTLSHLDGDRDGITFDPTVDLDRLNAQARRVFVLMSDMRWRTLAEVSERTGDPEASVSARLRDFRKPQFGAMPVERRRRAFHEGLWEYRLTPVRTVPYPNEEGQ